MPLVPSFQLLLRQIGADSIRLGPSSSEDEEIPNGNANEPQDPQALFRLLRAMQLRRDLDELDEEIPEKVLGSLDLDGVAEHLKEGRARKIIVMVGAGLSTAAGIPDFRTPGTGLYDNLQKYDLPNPEKIFDIEYFQFRPGAFYELAKEIWPGNFAPTTAHHFIKLLEEKSLLLRCYTQNIDSLEELAGVSRNLIVAAHGNFAAAHGVDTGKEVPIEEVRSAVMKGQDGWRDMVNMHKELIKPDIVFFGEELPERFHNLVKVDFPQCDLLIVMGTSLVVAPFCNCIAMVGPQCPRLLVNREAAGLEARGENAFSSSSVRGGFRLGNPERNYRDAFYAGDCDDGIEKLCSLLGWSEELHRIRQTNLELLKKQYPDIFSDAAVLTTTKIEGKGECGNPVLGSEVRIEGQESESSPKNAKPPKTTIRAHERHRGQQGEDKVRSRTRSRRRSKNKQRSRTKSNSVKRQRASPSVKRQRASPSGKRRSRSRGRRDRSRSRDRKDGRTRGRKDCSRSRGRKDRSRSRGQNDRRGRKRKQSRSGGRGKKDQKQSPPRKAKDALNVGKTSDKKGQSGSGGAGSRSGAPLKANCRKEVSKSRRSTFDMATWYPHAGWRIIFTTQK